MKNKFLIPIGVIWLVLLKAIFWVVITHFNHVAYGSPLHFSWDVLYELKPFFNGMNPSNARALKWLLHAGFISLLTLNMVFFFHVMGLVKKKYLLFLKLYLLLAVLSFVFILFGKYFDVAFLKSNGYLILSFVEGPWIFIILLLSQQLLTYPNKLLKH